MGIETTYVKGDLTFEVNAHEMTLNDFEPYVFVPVAPNLLIRPKYEINVKAVDLGITMSLEMRYNVDECRLLIWRCVFDNDLSFPGIKPTDIQKFPIEGVLKTFSPDLYWGEEKMSYGPLDDWEGLLQLVPFHRLKQQGPTGNTLKWVARIYNVCIIRHQSPTKSVSDLFGIPLRTASHWVKLMRERIWPEGFEDRKDWEGVYGIEIPSRDKANELFRAAALKAAD